MASDKKQKNDRKSILRHLRKGSYGFSIVFFILVLGVSAMAIWLFISAFLSYVLDNKLSAEYTNISYLAKTYEKGISDDGNSIYEIVDAMDRDYVITNSADEVIEGHGEDTRSTVRGKLTLSDKSVGVEEIEAYGDKSHPAPITVDKDGDLELTEFILRTWAKEVLKKAEKAKKESTSETEGPDVFTYDDENNSFSLNLNENTAVRVSTQGISIPIWLSVDVKDGREHFIGKANIDLNVKDGLFLIIFIIAISLIIFAVVVMMIARLFGAIATRNRMWNLFFLDTVTHQKNWMYFIFKGEPIVRKRKYAATNFAVMDVVFVKYRNFCLCHSVEEGEEQLRKVNALVTQNLKKDELCTHYASANFACLLRYDDDNALRERINTLIKSLEQLDGTRRFAFHVGVSCLPAVMNEGRAVRRKEVNLEKEYNNACAARATLSENDDSGIAFFDDKLVEEQRWIDIVRQNQEKAVANEEFVVYYQPKYDPRTNELKGAEALIRWDSPEFGFKSPGTIIPIFEKNGFITEIDHYMIRHVAKDQKKWLDEGLNCVPVSVNVSRAHFIEADLAEQIRDDVDRAGAPHELIEIELTESAFFDDKKAIVSTIKKLKEYGFAVSMDDFGSGYSSLNSLKDMPLDVLKLDADFFRGEMEGDRGEIVVSEAIKLAKNLHMRTVAEGVEVREQVDFLARQGCDMIQGFYFAKPMPADEYEQKMKSGVATEEVVEEIKVEAEADAPAGESENER